MKKILIVSTVSRQFYLFEQSNIEILHSLGYEVHGAANYEDASEKLDALDIIRHHFDIQRSPFSLKNIKAYKQLKKIMKSDNFDVVHCHSPMGGVLARLTARTLGIKNIIYTAHGFHFYKGAPLINWLFYYPIEKLLSKFTDVIITINKEDFKRAQSFKSKKVVYIPGIGVDVNKLINLDVDRNNKRKELDLPLDEFVILSVGELNKNKNHKVILKALAQIDNSNITYVICGKGVLKRYLMHLAKSLGISGKVKFLGFRNDVAEIYKIADIFVLPSFREGLSVSLLEAMASGLPVVCSRIRGNIDLIDDKEGGYLIKPNDVDKFSECINILKESKDSRYNMSFYNLNKVAYYDKDNIKQIMNKIYNESVTYEK